MNVWKKNKNIEVEIAKEQIIRPIIPREHIEAWIMNFAKTDLKSQEQKQRLIDIFVNSVHVYDDKIVVIFNYKDGEKYIRIDKLKTNKKKRTLRFLSVLLCLSLVTRTGIEMRSTLLVILRKLS